MRAMRHLVPGTREAAARLVQWVRGNGWAGWDPYDVHAYLFRRRSFGERLAPGEEERILRRDGEDPLGLRRELALRPTVNAKAMGLFLGAFAVLQAIGEVECREEIEQTSRWLAENRSPDFPGAGWGYPFDWAGFAVFPAGTPTGVISCHVADGFRAAHALTGDPQWLDRCGEVAEFLLRGLNADDVPGRGRCFSYTPLDFFHVNNANLSAAETLLWTGRRLGRGEYVEAGLGALDFALGEFDGRGTLAYWARGYEPEAGLRGFMDHYHTAAELRSLWRIGGLLPDRGDVAEAFQGYFEFYLREFFDAQARPILRPGWDWLPFDIHAGAEAAYLLGMTLEREDSRGMLERFLPWFLENCRNEDGSFVHRLERDGGGIRVRPIPFLRWGQAWTLRGLASVLEGLRTPGGEGRS